MFNKIPKVRKNYFRTNIKTDFCTAKNSQISSQLLFGKLPLEKRRYYGILPDSNRLNISSKYLQKVFSGEKEYLKFLEKSLSFDNASQKELNSWYYSKIAEKFGKNKDDFASLNVQIIILTHKINQLRKHIATNKKDSKAKYNVIRHHGRRQKLMRHLREKNFGQYKQVLVFCGLEDVWNPAKTSKHHRAHIPSAKYVPPLNPIF
ncbi:hypothetical protein MHBO_000817 [Bonamia ostreae]|uniref:Ribosomal protein S15 n=1 Tax=Bonamia ostreae TaxID=126728 RepID=A0ABV2AGY6_9EUKA